jgi:hypothetical protein
LTVRSSTSRDLYLKALRFLLLAATVGGCVPALAGAPDGSVSLRARSESAQEMTDQIVVGYAAKPAPGSAEESSAHGHIMQLARQNGMNARFKREWQRVGSMEA